MSAYGGPRTPSLMGSRQSVYSHSSSTVRTTRTGKSIKGKCSYYVSIVSNTVAQNFYILLSIDNFIVNISLYALKLKFWRLSDL